MALVTAAYGNPDHLACTGRAAKAVDRGVQVAVGAEGHCGGEVQAGGDAFAERVLGSPETNTTRSGD